MNHLPFTAQKHCRYCGKSEQEIELATQLTAVNERVKILESEIDWLNKIINLACIAVAVFSKKNKLSGNEWRKYFEREATNGQHNP